MYVVLKDLLVLKVVTVKNLNGPLVENLVIDKIKNCNIESVINAFNSNKAKVDTVFF